MQSWTRNSNISKINPYLISASVVRLFYIRIWKSTQRFRIIFRVWLIIITIPYARFCSFIHIFFYLHPNQSSMWDKKQKEKLLLDNLQKKIEDICCRLQTSSGGSMVDGVVWKGILGAWDRLESCSNSMFLKRKHQIKILSDQGYKNEERLVVILKATIGNHTKHLKYYFKKQASTKFS